MSRKVPELEGFAEPSGITSGFPLKPNRLSGWERMPDGLDEERDDGLRLGVEALVDYARFRVEEFA